MLYNFQKDVLWENTNYSWVYRTEIGIPKSKHKNNVLYFYKYQNSDVLLPKYGHPIFYRQDYTWLA